MIGIMATQATTVDAFKTLCAEIADAIAASDWATATSKYAQAEAVNCALELEVERNGSRVRRRDALAGLKVAIATASTVVSRASDDSRLISTRTRHNR
jgi:hypothetical protein